MTLDKIIFYRDLSKESTNIKKLLDKTFLLSAILVVGVLVFFVGQIILQNRVIDIQNQNQITVSGQGKVYAKPELNIALEESELTQIGDSGKVIIRFVNIGLTEIKFLIATLQPSANYEILSTNTAYIGDVSPDDFETAEFNIYA